jgi:hypothetical protein
MYASDNGERLPFSVGPDGWCPGMQNFSGGIELEHQSGHGQTVSSLQLI